MRTILVVLLLISCGLVVGCDRSASDKAVMAEAESKIKQMNREENEQRLKQLDEEGYYDVDQDRVSEMIDTIDDAAENVSDEQASKLREMASLVRQIQELTMTYDSILAEFIEAGGNDITNMTSEDDLDHRIAILERLKEHNGIVKAQVPRLLRQIGRLEGSGAFVEKQIPLQVKIRELDNQFYEYTEEMFEIARPYIDSLAVYEDGSFEFSSEIPDEQLNRYNELVDLIDQVGEEQAQLQRELLKMSS